MADASSAENRGPARRLLGPLAVLVALPVLMSAWIPTLPRLDFDLDPRIPTAGVRVTLGAAGFGWLALWGTAAAWAGVAASVAAGGRLRWRSTLLVLAGVAAAAWHLPSSFDDAYHGLGWVWAASAGLAAAHLGRHAAAWRWLLALPVGLLVPLLCQALSYRLVTHPATVAAYEAATAAGTWSGPGSDDPHGAAARLYERRLRINDATGPFGFANVLGTVAAALALAALATLPRPRGAHAWAGVAAAAAGVALVGLTRSAGAAAALAAGACLLAAAWATAGRLPPRVRRPALAVLAVGAVAGVVAVVIARGVAGVPTPEVGVDAERTLLFRSQYWSGAAQLWAGGAAWLGLGAGGFGEAYARVKSELAPESVTSTHNVLIDYAVMLGLGGLAWAALLPGWLGRAAWSQPPRGGVEEEKPGPIERPEAYAVAALAAVLFASEAWIRLPELAGADLLWRAAAAAGFVGLVLAARRAGRRGAALATLAAATAALVHGQLDMGFHQPPAAPLLWLLVGLAAGAAGRPPAAGARRVAPEARVPLVPLVPIAVAAVAAVGVVAVAQARLVAHASALAEAAALVRAQRPDLALPRLERAGVAVGRDRVTTRWRGRLLLEAAAAAAGAGDPAAAAALYDRIATTLGPADPTLGGEARLREADARLAAGAGAPAAAALRGRAVAFLETAAAASPTRPERRLRLGEARLAAGDRAGAAADFAEALRLDALLYLDPDTQMRAAERADLEERLRRLTAASR
ncbi:O-antigen ligase family protein [Phycisphaera mikurensis]|uniref:O-antigen ligase-related domain-containing protein n=1 Tax=Phycisphaera mikurensis (strain NBRC 102666 / KCTC 22515 / FYK2301M01) TaxID=1142394 RepID=I0ICG2_PHYMF|nr:O-antigen ligase family protein [Phycisphaera mikurensis]MBB6442174.1 hypothetical protein [Phycisphaera mikurensis]BAM02950.1 hypothetical protein PSMK_07910 [Phycisphaera mikurensis NBRC 102666]